MFQFWNKMKSGKVITNLFSNSIKEEVHTGIYVKSFHSEKSQDLSFQLDKGTKKCVPFVQQGWGRREGTLGKVLYTV